MDMPEEIWCSRHRNGWQIDKFKGTSEQDQYTRTSKYDELKALAERMANLLVDARETVCYYCCDINDEVPHCEECEEMQEALTEYTNFMKDKG